MLDDKYKKNTQNSFWDVLLNQDNILKNFYNKNIENFNINLSGSGSSMFIKYENEDEAIELANDTEYGLAGYVQGEPDHAKEVARKIRAGQVIINGGARGTGAPFGGYKSSGNGREHGLHGLEECLETKAVIAP